jgi:hypothetical protein
MKISHPNLAVGFLEVVGFICVFRIFDENFWFVI